MKKFDLIGITNRKFSTDDIYVNFEQICKKRSDVSTIVLREKDLDKTDYKNMAKKIINICDKYDKKCILHSFVDVCVELKHDKIHLPMPVFLQYAKFGNDFFEKFNLIGVSTHSVEDIKLIESVLKKYNIDKNKIYVTLGHIYKTNCKKGLEPRGIDFLRLCCEKSNIRVFAIGGINKVNIEEVKKTKASGACIMSELYI